MPAVANSADLAENGYFDVPLPQGAATAIMVQTSPLNAVGAVVVVKILAKAGWTPAQIDTIDPATGNRQNDLTGADKVGLIPSEALGAKYLRIQRTDATGGVCKVAVNVNNLGR